MLANWAIAAAVASVAAAVVYAHGGERQRYQTTLSIGGIVVQTDTLTGALRVCRPYPAPMRTVCDAWTDEARPQLP